MYEVGNKNSLKKQLIVFFAEESVFSVQGVKLWPDEKRTLSFKGNFQRNHRRNFQ
jgi:hypothetical protein